MNWLDPIGAGLSLICTYYFTCANRFAWLLGMAAIIVNVSLYWQKGIYGNFFLEGIYFASMVFGWIKWRSGCKAERMIRYLTLRQGLQIFLIAITSILIFSYVLSTWTDSDIPYWDATTTVLGLIAEWLLCLKIIHCWILWFIVDFLVAVLQWYKGIPFHSAIHWVYLIMAIMGYYRWHKLYHQPA